MCPKRCTREGNIRWREEEETVAGMRLEEQELDNPKTAVELGGAVAAAAVRSGPGIEERERLVS